MPSCLCKAACLNIFEYITAASALVSCPTDINFFRAATGCLLLYECLQEALRSSDCHISQWETHPGPVGTKERHTWDAEDGWGLTAAPAPWAGEMIFLFALMSPLERHGVPLSDVKMNKQLALSWVVIILMRPFLWTFTHVDAQLKFVPLVAKGDASIPDWMFLDFIGLPSKTLSWIMPVMSPSVNGIYIWKMLNHSGWVYLLRKSWCKNAQGQWAELLTVF